MRVVLSFIAVLLAAASLGFSPTHPSNRATHRSVSTDSAESTDTGGDRPAAWEAPAAPVHFIAVDVFIDSGANPLAAYDVEITFADETTRLAGVEGGTGPYTEAPHYDPAALHAQAADRVILADYVRGNAAPPSGETRVARLHLMTTTPEPAMTARVRAAGSDGATHIDAAARLEIITTPQNTGIDNGNEGATP